MEQVVWIAERIEGGDDVIVEMRRHSACGSCGACWVGDAPRRFVVHNPQRFPAGSWVIVRLDDRSFVSAASLAYLFPVVVGIMTGFLVAGGMETIGTHGDWAHDLRFGGGFFFGLVLSFMVTRCVDGRFRRRMIPVVIAAAEESEPEVASEPREEDS